MYLRAGGPTRAVIACLVLLGHATALFAGPCLRLASHPAAESTAAQADPEPRPACCCDADARSRGKCCCGTADDLPACCKSKSRRDNQPMPGSGFRDCPCKRPASAFWSVLEVGLPPAPADGPLPHPPAGTTRVTHPASHPLGHAPTPPPPRC